ncbi:Trp biosynthesis-associated membrane protein [Fodinicola feengrottensis]|uniref:TIGR02234 family membrane protein n=1 Tax=Fodinicola feengrottensis TaxID=435914 RepID=A0ABN2HQJ4_9ACTN|nr:Trp biosynthesis-associated membrane protein [Fodinicola feengrottensis]
MAQQHKTENPPRRTVGLAASFVLCAAGAGLALWATTQPWGTSLIHQVAPLPPVTKSIAGGAVAPISAALALVALAGTLALLALKRIGRTIVGAFLALCGLGILADAVAAVAGPDLRPTTASMSVTVTVWWVFLALLGGFLVLVSGVWVALYARRWTASQRYELGSDGKARVAAGGSNDAETWDALDRGEDPTR